MMLSKLRTIFRTWRTEERGSLSVEAVIVLPLLFWGLGGIYVFWDGFKAQNANVKAAYTIVDMLSRENVPIDNAYLDGARDIYRFLTETPDSGDIRISVVSMGLDAAGNPELELEWSEGTGPLQSHPGPDALDRFVPDFAVGDQMIIVETHMTWSPVFDVGMADLRLQEIAVAKPRFIPQLLWDDGSSSS